MNMRRQQMKMPLIMGTLFVAILMLGVVAFPGAALAAPSVVPSIGVVNYGLLIDKHPDTPKANEMLKAENDQAVKEFESKAANMGDKEKQDLSMQLRQRVEQKRIELLNSIAIKVDAAIKDVADAKGLSAVFHKSALAYGGQDITDEVLKKITGK